MSVEGVKRTIINTCAFEAVSKIEEDLSDRRGLRQEWEGIDDETKNEIRVTWARIVADAIKKAVGE